MKTLRVLLALILLVGLLLSPAPAVAQEPVEAWLAVYEGPGLGWDEVRAVAVDGTGDVYVTGAATGTERDYATIRYDGANGNLLWVASYNGSGNNVDEARAIAVHGGNVYVTGWAWGGPGTADDFATVAYAGDTGNSLWPGAAIYNGSGNSGDQPRAIAVDGNGNVYVTGTAVGAIGGNDYATIKYNGGSGTQLWAVTHNDPDNGVDVAMAIALDGASNVYVTGSRHSGSSEDYATIKYAPDGAQVWVAIYNDPAVSGSDEAWALAVDGAGNVYVTGHAATVAGQGYGTIKYQSDGSQEWAAFYYDGGLFGARAIALDGVGNVYVTGRSTGGPSHDYGTVKYDGATGAQE